MPEQIERARQAGFREYLTKPLDLQHLLNLLDELAAAAPSCNGLASKAEPV
jgi:CheY-like chemotaxis protein